MATTQSRTATATPKKPAFVLAEFSTPAAIIHACEAVRDAGYSKWDAHTPFPIHGMDKAMGLPDSRLGWIVAGMACAGFSTAAFIFFYMNGIDYPLIVGGKPGGAFIAATPVFFELTVLFSAFGAVFGMLGMNRLPQHHHTLFESDRFRAATDNKYFVSIDSTDPKFDLKKTRELLEKAHADAIEVLEEEPS
jgi:hypothetical protein